MKTNINLQIPDINDEKAIKKAINENFNRTKSYWGDSHKNVQTNILTIPNYNSNGNGYKLVFENEPNGESCEFIEEVLMFGLADFELNLDEDDEFILYKP